MTNIPPTLTIVATVGEYETRAAPVPSTARTWSPKLSIQPDGRMKLRVRSMWTTFAWTSTPGITPCGVAKKSRLSWNVAPAVPARALAGEGLICSPALDGPRASEEGPGFADAQREADPFELIAIDHLPVGPNGLRDRAAQIAVDVGSGR